MNALSCSRWCSTALTAVVPASGRDSPPPVSNAYLPVAIDTEGGSGADGVAVADVDGDGRLDILTTVDAGRAPMTHIAILLPASCPSMAKARVGLGYPLGIG